MKNNPKIILTASQLPSDKTHTSERAPGLAKKPSNFLPVYWAHQRAWKPRLRLLTPLPGGTTRPALGLKLALKFIGDLAGSTALAILLAFGLVATAAHSADVIAHPGHITGEVRFGNTKPEILSHLNQGRAALFSGDSSSPPLHFEARKDIPAGSPTFGFDLIAEAAPVGAAAGYVYSVDLDLLLPQQYVAHTQTAPGVRADEPVSVRFDECPGMLDIRFVDRPGGAPVSVTKAQFFAFDAGAAAPHALAYDVPGTGYQMVVHSGSVLHLQVLYSRGTDPMIDLINNYTDLTIAPALDCDKIRVVEVVVPPAEALGRITGMVEMQGERQIVQDGPGYARNPVMVADGAPNGEEFYKFGRYTFLDHPPISGPISFVLPNLLASEDFGPVFDAVRYRVWGRMQFRAGHALNYFRIPSLFGASRPLVLRGGLVDLGDMFIMQPGYVSGQVILKGPLEAGGFRSPLRHLRTASDVGTPAWLTSLYSSVEAQGVNRLAPGATETAYQGAAYTEFDGAFDGSSTVRANYELVLAGLKSQPSIWDLSRLNLYFDSRGTTDSFMVGKLLVTDRRPSEVTVQPSMRLAKDVRYCMGYVTVSFEVPPGTVFFRPAIAVNGHFAGTDAWGASVDYDVQTGAGEYLGTGVTLPFLGEPQTADSAARTGVVRLALPQGTYTFRPSINVVGPDGTSSVLNLPVLTNYVVGCESIGGLDTCLQVSLSDLPLCVGNASALIHGTVTGCTNVTQIVWDRGDGVTNTICRNCGLNPGFVFRLPVNGPCQDNTFTVTAFDSEGRSSHYTATIPADGIAPVMQCPTNILVQCADAKGARADFTPTVTDNCDPSPSLVCVPSSGSWFQVGDTMVTCYASDRCGNSNQCSFIVTVTTNCPPCIDIHCPTSITAYICGSNCMSVPFNVWATDLCSSNQVSVVTDLPSGYCFPLGTTWVNATATGSGQSARCSFPVTVLRNTNCPPVTDCGCCISNLLVNGSFESPGVPDGYVSLGGGNAVISGWTTVLNGVQYYNPIVAPSFLNTGSAADGNYLLDLAPAQGLGGGIQQTFATVPGRSYQVCFSLGTSKERGRTGTASVTVTVAGAAHAFNIATESPRIVWQRKQFSFVATSTSTTLVFSTMDDPALSFVNLDAVCVSDCCSDRTLKIIPSITIEWNCGILQSAPDVTGPYLDVPGASSPYTVLSTEPRRFFRTRQ